MATSLRAAERPRPWRDAPLEPVRFDVGDLDRSIRPQDDLDAFVNARWRRAHPVPVGHSCWDSFAILRERSLHQQAELAADAAAGAFGADAAARIVADFWASGLDAAGVAAGRGVLEAECTRIDAIGSRAELVVYLHDSHADGGDPLFRIELEPDHDDPSRQIAFVTPREPALRDPATFTEPSEAAARLRAAWLDHGATLLGLAGVADAHAAMARVFEVERELAATLPARAAARDVALAWNPLDLRADGACLLDWRTFFGRTGATAERCSLALPAYHAAIERLLRELPLPVWRVLLQLRAAENAAPWLDAPWRDAHDRFHALALRGRRAAPASWKRVLEAIETHAGDALGHLYARRHGSASTNARVRTLFESLRDAFAARLRRADWLGASTRELALAKLARMTAKIGYPERGPAAGEFGTSPGNFYGNVVAARSAKRRGTLARAGKPTERDAWSLTPQTVNARYDPRHNEILVPAALLQPPFFAADAEDAALYGGIGAVIAHEMTHGFDDQGSRFDGAGRLHDWWSAEDRARFTALAVRLCAAAGNWRSRGGETVDGRLTLGENIADFGGLAIALDAFERTRDAATDRPDENGFDARQRFFLHWATLWRQNLTADERRLRARIDVHAPADLRANAAAADLPAYARAFGCKNGDAMARSARLGIW